MMQRSRFEFGVFALLLGVTGAAFAADQSSTISGVVRDERGMPQIGALVQIVSADTIVRATVFTDPHGRYLIQRVLPGKYGVRASAALFVPASRDNLLLQPHRRAIVNLTLSALLDQFSWLPARPKAADESSDDWNWTLRSSASRPMLKLAEDGASASARDRDKGPARQISSRVTLSSGSRSFGDSGRHLSVRSARVQQDGSNVAVSASLASVDAPFSSARSGGLSTVIQRHLTSGGGLLASKVEYQAHPEIRSDSRGAGLNVLVISSAEKFDVGDFAEVEAGDQLQLVSGSTCATASRPFLRVSAHAGQGIDVTYSFATSPDVDGYDSAIWQDSVLPRAGGWGDQIALEKGNHQELALSRRSRSAMLAIALYADTLHRVAISGGDRDDALPFVPTAEIAASPSMLVDVSNGSFQALAEGYSNSGVNVLFTRTVGQNTWIALQYSTGSAMATSGGQAPRLAGDLPVLHARHAQSATVSVKTNIARTATKLRASYRWQPGVLVTSIDPYNLLAGGDYLSLGLRQRISLPGVLPDGIELTLDGTNLLAQGYQQFTGRSGRPLYLAASPSSLKAGLAFNF